MTEREELEGLRRLEELEAKAKGIPFPHESTLTTGKRTELRNPPPPLIRGLRPALSMAGMVGGGLVGGAALNPLTAALGVGLGYAGGEQASDLIEKALGYRKNEPLLNSALRAGEDVALGTGLERVGQFLPMAGRQVREYAKTPLRNFFAPPDMKEYAKRIAVQERTGIPFTFGQLTQNKPASLMESMFSQSLFPSKQAQKRARDIVGGMERNISENISPQVGGFTEKGEAGDVLLGLIGKRQKAWSDLVDTAYKEASDLMPVGVRPSLPNTNKFVEETLPQFEGGKFGSELYGILSKYRKPQEIGQGIFGKIPLESNPTYLGIINDQKVLNDMIGTAKKSQEWTKVKFLTDLRKNLDKDLQSVAKEVGGEFAEKHFYARELHGVGKEGLPGANVFRSDYMNKLINKDAAQFIDTIIKTNNPREINMVRNAVGEENWKTAQSGWLQKVFTMGKEKNFDPLLFRGAWNKLSTRQKEVLFPEQELRNMLGDLAESANIAEGSARLAGNPSGTGQALMTYYLMTSVPAGIMSSLVTGDIETGAKTTLGLVGLAVPPIIMAKAYFSKDGRQYLKTLSHIGLDNPRSPHLVRRIIQIGAADVIKNEETNNEKTNKESYKTSRIGRGFKKFLDLQHGGDQWE